LPDNRHNRSRELDGAPFVVEDFSGKAAADNAQPLGSGEPRVPTFDEFERPAPNPDQAWAQSPGTGPAAPGEGEPSLGYLFTPFDPGKVEDAKFHEEYKDLPPPENYEYVQMDTRDTGIVKTLEMANKKAAEIVGGAFEQGRRMVDMLMETAKHDASEIDREAKAKAEAFLAESQKSAQEKAEAIIAEADSKVAETVALRAEAEKLKSEAEATNKKADETLSAVQAKQAELAPREAEIEQIKAEIESQRQEILAQAKKDAEEAKAQAVAQGLAEGREQGRELGRQEAKTEVLAKAEGFFRVTARIDGIFQELWQRNAPSMVALAVDAAEAIVNKEIENGRGLAAGAFAACVEFLHKCNSATFRVCPSDLPEIEAARDALRGKIDGLTNVSFKPDPRLGPGDIVMESDAGLLDATLKNRRERVMAVLRQALEDGLVADLPPELPTQAPPAAEASPPEPAPPGPPDTPTEPPTPEAPAQDGPGQGA
jgi:flagellar biosynthesis/type III secretory pathway protein FliH